MLSYGKWLYVEMMGLRPEVDCDVRVVVKSPICNFGHDMVNAARLLVETNPCLITRFFINVFLKGVLRSNGIDA